MDGRIPHLWTQVVLIAILAAAVVYLGRVVWALRPMPAPLPTPTATPTPTAAPHVFDGFRSLEHVRVQLAFGPRLPGSRAAARTRQYVQYMLRRVGWDVAEEPFTFQDVALANVVARRGNGPVFIVGAHYDSRRHADRDPDPQKRQEPVPGANDGASGVAVLLELARVLEWDTNRYAIWLYFFDAEDQGRIDGWPWAVGAAHAAMRLPPDVDVRAVIVVDMVGDADQQLYWEGNSDPTLREQLWNVAAALGYGRYFVPQEKYTVIDDHVPFKERGLPAVDIIDFDYPYWHTTADTLDKVSASSLERVGRVLERWLESR